MRPPEAEEDDAAQNARQADRNQNAMQGKPSAQRHKVHGGSQRNEDGEKRPRDVAKLGQPKNLPEASIRIERSTADQIESQRRVAHEQ